VACRPPFGTIWFLQAATHRLRTQHLRCSNQRRSPTKIDSVHRAPPQGADPVTAMALVQTDPTAAFECSSQLPTPGCCDDRLNPPCGRYGARGRRDGPAVDIMQ